MLVTQARLPACAVLGLTADAVFLPMWVHLTCRTQSQLRSNTSSAHVELGVCGVWRGLSLTISHMKDFALACVYDLAGQL